MPEKGWLTSVFSNVIWQPKSWKSPSSHEFSKKSSKELKLLSSRPEHHENITVSNSTDEDHQYLWKTNHFIRDIQFHPKAETAPPAGSDSPAPQNRMMRNPVAKEESREELVPPSKRVTRSFSVSSEGKLNNVLGLSYQKDVHSAKKQSRPASAFSRLSTQSQPFTRSPVYAATYPNTSSSPDVPLPAQVEEMEKFQTNVQKVPIHSGRFRSEQLEGCISPRLQSGFPSDVQINLSLPPHPQSGPSSQPQSGPSSRPHSGPFSRPQSGLSLLSQPSSGPSSRPQSVLRSRRQIHTTVNISDYQEEPLYDEPLTPSRRRAFSSPDVHPIYQRVHTAPTPMSINNSTPMWETEGEKRVRFLEAEVVDTSSSRPSSAVSTYSNILKNSARYSFSPNEAHELYGVIGHSPKLCNCPCHFFPKMKKNVGVQVLKSELDSLRPPRPPPRPRHYRLFVVPTFSGLDELSLGSKFISLIVRALLSQVGLGIVVIIWWLLGALVFSTIERPLQEVQIMRMAAVRSDLVIELATELRQVKPYDSVWRDKIEEYTKRLETAILRAVKSGYSSNAVSWTIPQSVLYAVSLTSFLGPGGLVIQSPLTRIFSLLYSFVGIPIFFLFLFNVAQTIRENLTWAWTWRRRRKQISDSLLAGNQDTSSGNAENLNTVEEGVTFIEGPSSSRDIAQLIHISKVPILDSTLPGSRPSSAVSNDFPYQNTSPPPPPILSSELNVGASSSGFNVLHQSSSSKIPERDPVQNAPSVRQPLPVTLERSTNRFLSRKPVKERVPWFILLIFPIFYLILGTTLLVTTQKLTVISALFVIGNNLMFIDHGGIDNKQLFGSGFATIIYAIFLLLGITFSLIFILDTWPKIRSMLGEAGKHLSVVKPLRIAI